jgi:hypothetical protein
MDGVSQMSVETHFTIELDSIRWTLSDEILKIGAASEKTGCKIQVTRVCDCQLVKQSTHELVMSVNTRLGSELIVGRHHEEYIKIVYSDAVRPPSYIVILSDDRPTYNKPLLVDATILITDQDDDSDEDEESDNELAHERLNDTGDISDLIDDGELIYDPDAADSDW